MKQKISLLSMIQAAFHALVRPMPLVEFGDYDGYWERRSAEGKVSRILHRYSVVAKLIASGERVLDMGCGDGAFLDYLRTKDPSIVAVGADLSERAVACAAARGFSVVHTRPECPLTAQIPGLFDRIVVMEVIEHVVEAEQLMRQLLEFRPKSIIVTIPNSGYIIHRLRLGLFGRFPVTAIIYHMKEHVRFWTVKDFSDWCDHLGLEVVSVTGQENVGNPFARFLMRTWPSMFAGQLVYETRPVSSPAQG